ncbi:NlpC/P60 family protein [Bailinhaonella thermotolerans]|uniref:NlpC/P60 family protein n=2 Tax=Bailinhaonella thermotolerans TaxID=1070861 RepID=A0A3A4A6P4_9ACTN|nr:NlpC/P60 family protein [Bailinhaonella thermotolerans]
MALGLCVPLNTAAADPEPSMSELKAEVEKLHNQIESYTEQYNGLRVRLEQAKRAARVAQQNYTRAEKELQARRQKVADLAYSSYMNSGVDPAVPFVTSSDPRSYLDSAATLHTLRESRSEELAEVNRAKQTAERARASAEERARSVEKLVADIEAKKSKITKLVAKSESKLFDKAIAKAKSGKGGKVDIPIFGNSKAAIATRYALTQQGKPYVWGAEGPNSYDCSGLVMWAYEKVGISLPHYTGDQWTAGPHVSRSEMRAGDLVFFYNDLHHVGIYLGNGMMVHAPQTGDVVKVAPIAGRPFAGAVRIAD